MYVILIMFFIIILLFLYASIRLSSILSREEESKDYGNNRNMED